MSDFSVRSDNVDVEQIMRQIRARIREKRGVDYTEEEIRELANVKLEKFIDPKGVRSNLLEEYRRVSTPEAPAPNYAFGEDTLYETHRGPIKWIRSLLRPFLKLLFNPNPLIQALHIQSQLNQKAAERNARREQLDALHYEVIHNLVVELTRTGVEVKSLKMRLESMASRLDFDERRARALEGVVQYRPGAVPPLQVPSGQEQRDQRRQDNRRPRTNTDQPRTNTDQPRTNTDQPRTNTDQHGSQHPRRDQGPRPQHGQQSQGGPQPPREGAGEGNALDNDGNERRARRRRRRGRRRGGEGRGSAFAGGETNAGFGETRPAASAEHGDSAASLGPSESDDHRSSDIGHRSSDGGGENGGGSSTPPPSAPAE